MCGDHWEHLGPFPYAVHGMFTVFRHSVPHGPLRAHQASSHPPGRLPFASCHMGSLAVRLLALFVTLATAVTANECSADSPDSWWKTSPDVPLADNAPIVMVVGASRGIGLALAEAYALGGARVHATVRNLEGKMARALAARYIDGRVVLHQLDLLNVTDHLASLATKQVVHRLDTLVLVAGVNTGVRTIARTYCARLDSL